jgi:hypothetical protein
MFIIEITLPPGCDDLLQCHHARGASIGIVDGVKASPPENGASTKPTAPVRYGPLEALLPRIFRDAQDAFSFHFSPDATTMPLP